MNKKYTFLIIGLLCYAFAKAQLQFCDGILGPAIFTEDFGSGTNNGPALSNTVTSYQYVNAAPQDGEYTISSDSGQLGSWFSFPDHTGNNNGKMLIVNAGFTAGQFYRTPINGLCENTPYEFSAWIMNVLDGVQNVCGSTEIPIQVRFEIWDATDTTLLADGTMNPKFADQRPTWIKYGLTFTTSAGQNGIILKMINVGAGGCGNDLAIDDISFNVCGDDVLIATSMGETVVSKCDNNPAQVLQLTATVQSGAPSLTAYQWQQSSDGSTFTDIAGANGFSFNTPPLNSTTYYRVKIAGAPANLTNSSCFSFSQVFEFRNVAVPLAVPRQNPYISCDGELVDLIVDVAPGTTAFWYENATGGNSIHDDSIDYTTTVDGTYWVETQDIATGCLSNSRVPINFINRSSPIVNSDDFLLCPGEMALLNTQFTNGFYRWSSGETTDRITVDRAGLYTCEVTNLEGCTTTAIFNVDFIETPVISTVSVTGDELTVIMLNSGDFQYSIDGLNYYNEPVFNINGLLQVNVRVKDRTGCEVSFFTYNRISIPLFFTPNNDGYHDTWDIDNIDAFPGARLEIFDRYGKLIKQINNLVVGWDGLYDNQPLPSSDYWYKLYYNEQLLTGHFTLKR